MVANCYWVYILLCQKERFYTGYTNDIIRRYKSHLDGTGRCKFTLSFKPLMIASCWKVAAEKSLAMKAERFIKKLSHLKKQDLVQNPNVLCNYFSVTSISKEELQSINDHFKS